jgi:hypothetical protein
MSDMAAIARREGNEIIPTCIMGHLTILHESASGVLVVKEASRKHWRKGQPDLPTKYHLMRLVAGAEQPHLYRRMLFNSRHLDEYPLVLLGLGVSVEPGRHWQACRKALIKQAENIAARNARPAAEDALERAGYAVDVEEWEPGFVRVAWRSARSTDAYNDADVVIGRDDANWHEEIPAALTRGAAGERLQALVPGGHTLSFEEPLLFEDAQDAVKAEGFDPDAGRFIVFKPDVHGH